MFPVGPVSKKFCHTSQLLLQSENEIEFGGLTIGTIRKFVTLG